MKAKSILGGLGLGLISILALGCNVNASDYSTLEVTKEGKYVVKDYDQDMWDDMEDKNEINFIPEKTGVYSLTSLVNGNCGRIGINLKENGDVFDITSSENNEKNKLSVTKKVYLEKGKKYFISIFLFENKDVKDIDFEIKFDKEMVLNPAVNGKITNAKGKEIAFDKYKNKGFSWDEDKNTITLDNCKIEGYIECDTDFEKYDFDFAKRNIKSVFTINVKGNSSIILPDEDLSTAVYCYSSCLNIVGEGKNKSSLKINAFDSNLEDDNSIISIGDIKFECDDLHIWNGKTVIKNSCVKFKKTWSEIGPDEDYDGDRSYKSTDEYSKWVCEFYKSVWGSLSAVDSEIEVEFELLPSAYTGKNMKNVIVRGGLFDEIEEFTNSKLTIKADKNVIKCIKKGKIKIAENKIKNVVYKKLKSYRNGPKVGSLIYSEIKYSKKYKEALWSEGYTYRVIKSASTDGKKIGKVYVHDYTNRDRDKIKKVTIGEKIYSHGCVYKVVGIDKKAFANMKKLNKVVINSKLIKKIGKNAFTKKGEKITFVLPKNKKNKYKKLLKKAKVKNYKVA